MAGPATVEARHRRSLPLRACAALGAVATMVAIVLRIVAPFDHGSWLIAYLLLVGSVAPFLLAGGQRRAGVVADRRARIEAAGWLAGVIAVPAGVLLDARLPVVVGGLALLATLASIARRSLSGDGAEVRVEPMHGAVIAFMALSTLVGVGLAWDTPWI